MSFRADAQVVWTTSQNVLHIRLLIWLSNAMVFHMFWGSSIIPSKVGPALSLFQTQLYLGKSRLETNDHPMTLAWFLFIMDLFSENAGTTAPFYRVRSTGTVLLAIFGSRLLRIPESSDRNCRFFGRNSRRILKMVAVAGQNERQRVAGGP